MKETTRKPVHYTNEDLEEARIGLRSTTAEATADAKGSTNQARSDRLDQTNYIMDIILHPGERKASDMYALMENISWLEEKSRFGVPEGKRKLLQAQLWGDVWYAWEKEQSNMLVCFMLCYAAKALEKDLPKAKGNTKRKKNAAKRLFELYQEGGYQKLKKYIDICKLM